MNSERVTYYNSPTKLPDSSIVFTLQLRYKKYISPSTDVVTFSFTLIKLSVTQNYIGTASLSKCKLPK